MRQTKFNKKIFILTITILLVLQIVDAQLVKIDPEGRYKQVKQESSERISKYLELQDIVSQFREYEEKNPEVLKQKIQEINSIIQDLGRQYEKQRTEYMNYRTVKGAQLYWEAALLINNDKNIFISLKNRFNEKLQRLQKEAQQKPIQKLPLPQEITRKEPDLRTKVRKELVVALLPKEAKQTATLKTKQAPPKKKIKAKQAIAKKLEKKQDIIKIESGKSPKKIEKTIIKKFKKSKKNSKDLIKEQKKIKKGKSHLSN